jgi:hypothetical protein
MLQKSYASQDQIPENLRGAYIQKGSEWVLDDLSDDHPVVTHKKTLERDLSTERGKVTRLTNDKTELEKNVLPPGTKAVPEADAELVELVKPLGDKKAVKAVLDEHKTLATEKQEREQDSLLERAAKELGYENVAAFRAVAKGLKLDIKFKPEKIDGKDVEKPYVGDKSLADHIAATPELKDAEPVFKAKPQAPAPSTEGGSGNRPAPEGGGDKGGGDKQQTYRFQEPGDVKWE